MTNRDRQELLPFACFGCPFNLLGRCKGPVSSGTYLMQDKSLMSCIDISRRGKYFVETYDRLIEIPESSHHDRFILPPFIPGVAGGIKAVRIPNSPIAVVALADILGSRGDLLFADVEQIRRRFGLPVDIGV